MAESRVGIEESWLSEDPAEDWDSVNRYAFVGLAPNMGRDPLGLGTEKIAMGTAGEAALVKHLTEEGWTVFWGGGDHRTNAGGPDVFAFNNKTGELAFFDDKNWTAKSSVSRVNCLVDSKLRNSVHFERARELVRSSNMDFELKATLLDRLEGGSYSRLVSAAAETSKVVRVTERVEKDGIRFYDAKKRRLVKGGTIAGAVLTAIAVWTAETPAEAQVVMRETIDVGQVLRPLDQNTPTQEEEMRSLYGAMFLPLLVPPETAPATAPRSGDRVEPKR